MNPYLAATIKLFGTPKWLVLKAQRNLSHKRRWPSGKVSPNFRYREFYCRDGMPFPIRAQAHLAWYARNILEPMRLKFGPAFISGPYRHYWYNRNEVHRAPQSYHVWDRYVDGTVDDSALACDLSFATGTVQDWAAEAEKILRKLGRGGGIGVYPRSRFTHVDTRRGAARWTG